jgi:hypothetical protein
MFLKNFLIHFQGKNSRCDAYYHDAEGAIHEIFTEEDFRFDSTFIIYFNFKFNLGQ